MLMGANMKAITGGSGTGPKAITGSSMGG